MSYNTTVTYKGVTRAIDPADLTSAAAMLSFYDAKVNQYTVAGIRRLTFHLTVTEGSEPIAIRDVQRIARQLQVGPYAEKTVVIEPPLRTTPRPGKRFHRGWRVKVLPDARGTFRQVESQPEGAPVAEPTPVSKKALKRAKKLKKAKKGHPATGVDIPSRRGDTGVTGGTVINMVVPATRDVVQPGEEIADKDLPITGYLHYSKGKEGNQKGKHRWELSALNRREVDNSGEGFTSLTRSEGNIDAITRALVNPKVTYDAEDYPTKQ